MVTAEMIVADAPLLPAGAVADVKVGVSAAKLAPELLLRSKV
jgi:hypothetical protein